MYLPQTWNACTCTLSSCCSLFRRTGRYQYGTCFCENPAERALVRRYDGRSAHGPLTLATLITLTTLTTLTTSCLHRPLGKVPVEGTARDGLDLHQIPSNTTTNTGRVYFYFIIYGDASLLLPT